MLATMFAAMFVAARGLARRGARIAIDARRRRRVALAAIAAAAATATPATARPPLATLVGACGRTVRCLFRIHLALGRDNGRRCAG